MNFSPRTGALICILLASLCLGAGYLAAGQWLGLALTAVILAVWLTSRRRDFESRVAVLPAAVLLAAFGTWAGAAPSLMIIAVALALASWDLTMFDRSLSGSVADPAVARLLRKHYTSLCLVLGSGLLAAFAGRVFAVQLPFIAVLVLVAALAFFLERAWQTLRR